MTGISSMVWLAFMAAALQAIHNGHIDVQQHQCCFQLCFVLRYCVENCCLTHGVIHTVCGLFCKKFFQLSNPTMTAFLRPRVGEGLYRSANAQRTEMRIAGYRCICAAVQICSIVSRNAG